MKRLPIIALATTCILLAIIILRVGTRRKAPTLNKQQQNSVRQMIGSFDGVATRPLTLGDFIQAVRSQSAPDIGRMPPGDRDKLFACIARFYKCYSSGQFGAFRDFRLRPPWSIGRGVALSAKKINEERGLSQTSDEDALRTVWDKFNGTNAIGEVNEESISLSITNRHDLGRDLRQPPNTRVNGIPPAAVCWGGSVLYEPSPEDILKREGFLRFFILQVSVRFRPLTRGPATPLVLLGYWDSTRADWMPYALCTAFHVGGYDTIF